MSTTLSLGPALALGTAWLGHRVVLGHGVVRGHGSGRPCTLAACLVLRCSYEGMPGTGQPCSSCLPLALALCLEPNARFQARSIAGARYERRLLSVACKPLFGKRLDSILGHGMGP